MHRIALIPIVAALTAGTALAANASAEDPPSQASHRREVLRLFSVANLDAEVYVRADGAPPPTSADDVAAVGDVTILEDELFALHARTQRASGDRLGAANGLCTFTAVDRPSLLELRADALCSGVVSLPGGTLTVEGYVTIDFARAARDVYAITGGTGTYAGAGGTVIVTGLPPEGDVESAIYEFRFTR